MTLWRYILRATLHYRGAGLAVAAGVAVSTAVLVGALVVGDSMRYSLHRLARARLGRTQAALAAQGRFFRADLAPRLGARVGADAASLLTLPCVAGAPNGRRLNRAELIGVDRSAAALLTLPAALLPLADGEAAIGRKVAERLSCGPGDELVLRVIKPSAMPYEAPLASDREAAIALRIRVVRVLETEEGGRFSLRSSQELPANVYVSSVWLAGRLGLPGRANLLLVSGDAPTAQLDQALADVCSLDDLGLELTAPPGGRVAELRARDVFMSRDVVEAARGADPSASVSLTYFVNALRRPAAETPYSFVAAVDERAGLGVIGPGEMVLTRWAAADLGASAGDTVALDYVVPAGASGLVETSCVLRVARVLADEGPPGARGLTPDFPGLSGTADCRDWTPGVAIDPTRIRPRDEAYWDAFGPTPKAYVGLATGQSLWSNRFGVATMLRYDAEGDAALERVRAGLRARITPARAGLAFSAVREEGEAAGAQATDFGQLFLGLSFFVIAAAVLLLSVLFVFGVETRSAQVGLLRALGFRTRRIAALFLAEGLLAAVAGCAVGCALAIVYNRLVLLALGSLWRGTIGPLELFVRVRPATLAAGCAAALAVCGGAMGLALIAVGRRSAAGLQAGGARSGQPARRSGVWARVLAAGLCIGAAAVLVGMTPPGRGHDAAGAFFGAGALLLAGALQGTGAVLAALSRRRAAAAPSLIGVALRSCAQRRGRSTATVAVLACGVFMVAAVAANRRTAGAGNGRRDTGTGGFAFYGETSQPVLYDLNSESGRRHFGLDEGLARGLKFVQGRVREGDEASCLNLNRVQRPRLVGIAPEALAQRGAFRFSGVAEDAGGAGWERLDAVRADGCVPAIADEAVIVWSLGKSLGDTLEVPGDGGEPVVLKFVAALAPSILQGSVVISDRAFTKHFGSISGTRLLLVDAAEGDARRAAQTLSEQLGDVGLELTPARDRLAEFNRVENTYLAIFLLLGGLGVALGAGGLAIVLVRNVGDRRGELALLRAVGFDRWRLAGMLLLEHAILLSWGVACGLGAAVVAVVPALRTAPSETPFTGVAVVVLAVFANGLLWTAAACARSVRADLLSSLRRE